MTMAEIAKVTWYEWRGVSKKRNTAYFKSSQTASKFIQELTDAKDVFDVRVEEGLSLADVKAESGV